MVPFVSLTSCKVGIWVVSCAAIIQVIMQWSFSSRCFVSTQVTVVTETASKMDQ